MTPNKPRIRQLVEVLRSGEYAQGEGQLRTGNSFCCLGVACDISGLGEWLGNAFFCFNGQRAVGLLPETVQEYFGFDQNVGRLPKEVNGYDSLVFMNDDGRSFSEIAAVLEDQFLQED